MFIKNGWNPLHPLGNRVKLASYGFPCSQLNGKLAIQSMIFLTLLDQKLKISDKFKIESRISTTEVMLMSKNSVEDKPASNSLE